jgi:hypothetical protein
MYDWELEKYLNDRHNQISDKEYIHICNTCPQINHVKYDAWNDRFEIWTDDRGYFSFSVYRQKE